MFKVVEGDVFESDADILIHGCNCFCKMGAGVANIVRKLYPEAYAADLQTVTGDISKLGSYTFADVLHKTTKKPLKVINAYTQYSLGKDFRKYSFEHVMEKIKNDFKGKTIAMPCIGAGIAGGSIGSIVATLTKIFDGQDITVTMYVRQGDHNFKYFKDRKMI